MQVAVILTGWLLFWMGAGAVLGGLQFGTPLTGSMNGFLFGVVATFAWPWIVPSFIDNWMDDDYVPTW